VIKEQQAAIEATVAEHGYRCDKCKAALAVCFFDRSWVCAACANAMCRKLLEERWSGIYVRP